MDTKVQLIRDLDVLDSDIEKDLKDALKKEGVKFVGFTEVRRSLYGNKRFIVVAKKDNMFYTYQYTLYNGLYFKSKPFRTEELAVGNANTMGYFPDDCNIGETVFDKIYKEANPSNAQPGNEPSAFFEGYNR